MTEPLYCRLCGGKYHQYRLSGSSSTCIDVAETCGWCGADFWDAKPTYKDFLKKKDLSKKHVKIKQRKIDKLMEDISV